MNARRWLKLACLLVIVCGVGLKLAISRQIDAEPPPPLKAEVAIFLTQQGFTITSSTNNLDLALVEAARGPDCALTVAVMAPQGWHGGVVRSLLPPGEDLFFVFDGAIYNHQPVMRSRLQLYATLLARRLGFAAPLHPLLGVMAPPACNAQALPWQDIARLFAALPGG